VYSRPVNAADVGPVAPADQTQSPVDLCLIFVGANVVATTFQVGASLASSFTASTATLLISAGSAGGAALVAVLAPLGPRLRVPSVIAARAALGVNGAALVAAVLYASNFAWIALNNVIAASACARVLGRSGSAAQGAIAIALGLIATIVVWRGPRAVALADRVAVPLMALVAVALTAACLRLPASTASPKAEALPWTRGLDVVIAYQVSWLLMFADYSRYTKSARAAGWSVFIALASTSAWLMPLGLVAARAAGTDDPGAMLAAVGLGELGALLLVIATVTTNFVNIYMSSLAWKSLMPQARDAAVIWSIGVVGAALSGFPGVWLAHYTSFMVVLGAILVPVGGVLIACYYFRRPNLRDEEITSALYDARGRFRGISAAGVAAWAAGAAVFFLSTSVGGTLPALMVSMTVYLLLSRREGPAADRRTRPVERV